MMKVVMMHKLVGKYLLKFVEDRTSRKAIYKEYIEILKRAKPLETSNPLLSSYLLAAFFIAMNRVGKLSVEENYLVLEKGIKTSKLVPMMLGNADSYLSEKKMKQRFEWSKKTHLKEYENDWVVDILTKSDTYDLGYNYYECGVCKLCKDEHCFEYAKYLCKLDFLLSSLIGLKLTRTMTLADEDPYCDFRFKRKDE